MFHHSSFSQTSFNTTSFRFDVSGPVVQYTNLMDAIRGVTGGNTIQDGLCLWYGKTATETAQDAERRFLLAFGGTTAGTNQDLWGQYLSSLGHTGTLNDKLLKYWNSQ